MPEDHPLRLFVAVWFRNVSPVDQGYRSTSQSARFESRLIMVRPGDSFQVSDEADAAALRKMRGIFEEVK
jgi:hypothetical protein